MPILLALVIPSCLDEKSQGSGVGLPAPSDLAGTPASDGTSVELTWQDNSTGETGFRIDVAPVPILSDKDVANYATVGPDATSYSYPTLPNTTRFFRVLAITPSQQSEPSNAISVTSPDVPLRPSGVDSLVGPDGSDVNVILYWNDLANESAYEIEKSANGGAWQSLTNPGANGTTFTDTNTLLGADYRYRIRGTNVNGAGAWSSIARAQTRDPSWSIVTSSATGDISWHVSVVGSPHPVLRIGPSLLCYDAANGGLVWGAPGSTSITVNPIDPGFPSSLGFSGTSFVTNARGFPHIVANDALGLGFYYVVRNADSWLATPIARSTATDRAIIRLDSSNTPHVIFQITEAGVTRLRHAWKEGASWEFEDVWEEPVSDFFAFTMGADNSLHVCHRRILSSSKHELVYLKKPVGGSWSVSVLPAAGSVEFSSIALDGAGGIHISYNELTTAGLHHTTNASGSWVTELVHQSPRGSWGRFNSMVIESAGRIHIAYYDSVSANLRYAGKQLGGEWTHSLVDGIGDVGRFCSIAVDWTGVLIGYGDASSGQVKLARKPAQ